MKTSKTIELKEVHPKSKNGDQVGKLIKETRGYSWYHFSFNKQTIRIKKY